MKYHQINQQDTAAEAMRERPTPECERAIQAARLVKVIARELGATTANGNDPRWDLAAQIHWDMMRAQRQETAKPAATEGTSLFGMQVNALRLNTARQTAGEQRQSGRTTGLLLQALGNAVMSPGSEVEFKDHAPHSSTIGALLLAAQLQAMADALELKVAARNHVCSVFVTSLHEPPIARFREQPGVAPTKNADAALE
jgi:hypothetical protein